MYLRPELNLHPQLLHNVHINVYSTLRTNVESMLMIQLKWKLIQRWSINFGATLIYQKTGLLQGGPKHHALANSEPFSFEHNLTQILSDSNNFWQKYKQMNTLRTLAPKIIQIGQYLRELCSNEKKIWIRKCHAFFGGHPVYLYRPSWGAWWLAEIK